MAAQTTFTYTISDGDGNQSTATVTVDITDVIPNANAQDDGPINITAGSTLTFPVLNNDSPAGVVLDPTNPIVTGPTRGTATVVGSQIRYVPTSGLLGPDSLVYRIRLPANNTTDTATMFVQVNAAGGGSNRSGLPWKSGVTSGGDINNAIAFCTRRNRLCDITMAYTDGPNWGKKDPLANADLQWNKVLSTNTTKPFGAIQDRMEAGMHVVMAQCMLVVQERGDFQMIASGGRDAEHIQLATNIASWYNAKGPNYPLLYMCFGQEASFTTYPWSIMQKPAGQSPSVYINAYRRVSQIYKDRIGGPSNSTTGARRVLITWNGLRNGGPIEQHYPGNDILDFITCDGYDNGHNGSWFSSNAQFQTWLGRTSSIAAGWEGFDACRRYAASKGKKFGIQEWAPTWEDSPIGCPAGSRTPNNPYYTDGLFAFFNEFKADLDHEIFFNNSIPFKDVMPCGFLQQHQIDPTHPHLAIPSARYFSTDNWRRA